MGGSQVTIKGADGDFAAYVARPAAAKAPAVIVLQEIFGVNAVMRGVADQLAVQGFLAICPDLFWRLQPGVDITDKTPEEWKQALDLMGRFNVDSGVQDIAATIAHIRADSGCSGKVGTVGYCLGGKLAFMAATRTDADASVSYYGVGLENLLSETIQSPLLMHVAGRDGFSSDAARAAILEGLKDNPLVTIELYPGRDHAFARPGGEHYDAADAALADAYTLEFFQRNLG